MLNHITARIFKMSIKKDFNMGKSLQAHFERVNRESDTTLNDDTKLAVMSSIDVRGVLERWGIEPELRGNQWIGRCPDHHIHAGRISNQRKWTMNADTGDTFCFTGNFGSNIVYIARRLYNLQSIDETIDHLTSGVGIPYIPPAFIINQQAVSSQEEREQERLERLHKNLSSMRQILSRPRLNDACLAYFAKDAITKDTLEFLCVSSIERGFYDGRAVIPFLDAKRALCGFVAVDYMGKEWTVRSNVDRMCRINGRDNIKEFIKYCDKNYRKVLHCPGFKAAEHIYGYYEVLNGRTGLDELVVVEGERDAIKLLQEGINAVSLHGTFVKDEQRNMIKQINPDTLFLGFDMDEAGNDATEKAVRKFAGEVENCLVLNFPGGKDPKKFNYAELRQIIDVAVRHNVKSREIECAHWMS